MTNGGKSVRRRTVFFVDNPTRGVDVLMPRGRHGRGCQNPTEKRALPLPRRLVRAVRLDLVDSMELDRRARRLAEDTAPHTEGQGTPARRA